MQSRRDRIRKRAAAFRRIRDRRGLPCGAPCRPAMYLAISATLTRSVNFSNGIENPNCSSSASESWSARTESPPMTKKSASRSKSGEQFNNRAQAVAAAYSMGSSPRGFATPCVSQSRRWTWFSNRPSPIAAASSRRRTFPSGVLGTSRLSMSATASGTNRNVEARIARTSAAAAASAKSPTSSTATNIAKGLPRPDRAPGGA